MTEQMREIHLAMLFCRLGHLGSEMNTTGMSPLIYAAYCEGKQQRLLDQIREQKQARLVAAKQQTEDALALFGLVVGLSVITLLSILGRIL